LVYQNALFGAILKPAADMLSSRVLWREKVVTVSMMVAQFAFRATDGGIPAPV
jgi:hypothetical protein